MPRTSIVQTVILTLAATATAAAGCGNLVGFDQDYQEGTTGAGGSGPTASASSGAGTTSGAGGAYTGPPSCAGMKAICGPNADEDCCASPIVDGGKFHRDNDVKYLASVSSFKLDRFEVTVRRFRKFVEAYPKSRPMPGDGVNAKVPMSGWRADWDAYLADTAEKLTSNMFKGCAGSPDPVYPTWTNMPGDNEDKPINCLSWFDAFAFCAWDGGRLPTDLEWNYAAQGGSEQRIYPWGKTEPDINYASFNCLGDGVNGCSIDDILTVGKPAKGDGKWHQSDLAGNVWEWNLDQWLSSYPANCEDCAVLEDPEGLGKVFRGGGWGNNSAIIQADYSEQAEPTHRADALGVRCARNVTP